MTNTISENIEIQKEDILVIKNTGCIQQLIPNEGCMEIPEDEINRKGPRQRRNNKNEHKYENVIIDIPHNAEMDIKAIYDDIFNIKTNSDKLKYSDESDSESEEIEQSESDTNDGNSCGNIIINVFKVIFCNPCINYIANRKNNKRNEENKDDDLSANNTTEIDEQTNQNIDNARTRRGWRIIKSIRNLRFRGSNRSSYDFDKQIDEAFNKDSSEESNDIVAIDTGVGTEKDKIAIVESVDINEITSENVSQIDSQFDSNSESVSHTHVSEETNDSDKNYLDNVCQIDEVSHSTQEVPFDEDNEDNEDSEDSSYSSYSSESNDTSVVDIDNQKAGTSETESDIDLGLSPSDIEIIKNNLKVIASLEPGNKLYEDYYGRLSIDNSYVPGLMRRLTGNSRSNTIPRVVKTIEDAKTLEDPEIVELVNDDVIKGLRNLIRTYSDDEVSSALSNVASTGDTDTMEDKDNSDGSNDIDRIDRI